MYTSLNNTMRKNTDILTGEQNGYLGKHFKLDQ